MRVRAVLLLGIAALGAIGVLEAQRPFKQYEAEEYEDFPLPPDWNQKAEWTRARLKYPSVYANSFRPDLNWTIDYPRSDRHLLQGVRRLTRIETRSVEQIVELDGTDDVYNWPMMYAVEVGHWVLPDDQVKQLREFLLRGGFLMVDDFWGPDPEQWEIFKDTMAKVMPGKPISDIGMGDAVMHVLYDIQRKDLSFIPGTRHLRRGPGGTVVVQQPFGTQPAWRAMYDDRNRMDVAVNYNTDIGDAWEYADAPEYPEHMTALAYRYGINYLVYAMTH